MEKFTASQKYYKVAPRNTVLKIISLYTFCSFLELFFPVDVWNVDDTNTK